jgi:hypothetical protein
MSEAGPVIVAEVPISAHSIVLSHGTYCVFVIGVSPDVPQRDLPALHISSSPGSSAVAVAALPGDGWLRQLGDAVLIRVASHTSRVLFTSYDESRVPGAKPPQIQIQRLDDGRIPETLRAPASAPISDYLMHFSRKGDVLAGFGDWVGWPGEDTWIEGIQIQAPEGLAPEQLECQAVLGRGWLSPWVPSGEFCGSRGMGLPLLGFRARLIGQATQEWRLSYAARCINGQELPEMSDGGACESPDLMPLAALKVTLEPVKQAVVAAPIVAPEPAAKPPKAKAEAAPAPAPNRKAPAAKPSATKKA